MAVNFPSSLDNGTSLPNPSGTNTQDNPDHASLHTLENQALIAVETKLGTGSSTPASNTLLLGTGAGTSSWTALTSSQLAGVLSDETGSGSAVFANTPTLITPKVDTINENTLNNGVTVAGLSIKSGALNTNNAVVSSNITNGAVTASKLGLNPQQQLVSTDETTTSVTYTDLTTVGPTVTVTIGANGLALVVWAAGLYNVAAFKGVSVALSGANTVAASDNVALRDDASVSFSGLQSTFYLFTGLTAGSTTFTLKYRTASGTAHFFNRKIAVIPL